MDHKKILILTYYWPPSGGAGVQRWVKFCKYLPDFGIEPVVLTVEKGTYPIIDESLTEEIDPELKVYTSGSLEPYSIFGKLTGKTDKEVSTPATAFSTEGGLVHKAGVWIRSNFFIPDARIGWIPFAYNAAKQIIRENEIDTIVTTGPPNSTHVTGTKLKEWNPALRWIMDMRDPWSQIFYNQSLPRTSIAQQIDQKKEVNALSLADEVIVVSDSMAALQTKIFDRNYHVITNGFDHEDFKQNPSGSDQDQFTIKYIGSMTDAAIPHNFFKALSNLKEDEREQFSLEFFGSYNHSIYKEIKDQGLDSIAKFKGYIPHLAAKKEMQSADLLLLVIPDTEDNELIMTGKIFDYIGAGKPILYIGPEHGDAAELIREYQLGECFGYNEKDTLTEYLRTILKGSSMSYKSWDLPLKDHPFSRYSLTKRLSDILQ